MHNKSWTLKFAEKDRLKGTNLVRQEGRRSWGGSETPLYLEEQQTEKVYRATLGSHDQGKRTEQSDKMEGKRSHE